MTPEVVAQASWEELLELLGQERREHELLRRMLDRFCREEEIEAAALYVETDGCRQLEVALGSDDFPARLDGEPEELVTIQLPGATLAFLKSAGRPSPSGEFSLALAATVRVHRLREQLKERTFQASYQGVELQALYDVGLAIAGTLNQDELSEVILLRAVSLLDARRGALYLSENGEYRLERTIAGDARERIAQDDPLVTALLEQRAPADQDLLPGARHVLAEPIETEAERRGLLVVADKESRTGVGPFQPGDRRSLLLFANQAAIALENAQLHRQALEKERLEREMELAADIQRRLLPTAVPALPGFELKGWNRPARHVGGDYYDFIPLGGGTVAMVVGDVSGKGMPAALMVSTVHTALRLLAEGLDMGPALMERLNRHISDTSAPNKFITFFVAEMDPSGSVLHYLNAGHNPAIVVSPDGAARELAPGGLPLGLMPGGSYEGAELEMGAGDLLCIYSDGITEAESRSDEEFGVERLTEVLREHHDEPLDEIVRAIDRATSEFAQGMPQGDDQTVLLLRKVE